MLLIVLRKMLSNKWMVACLLIGSILAVAMVSSIPIYSDGALQRMLTKDLDKYYKTKGVNPGGYNIEADFSYKFSGKDSISACEIFDRKINGSMARDIKLPVVGKVSGRTIENVVPVPGTSREYNPVSGEVRLETLSDLQKHVKMVNGRMFSAKCVDGVFEVVVTEEAMKDLDLRLNETYSISPMDKNASNTFKIKVTGAFSPKDAADPYWFKTMDKYNMSLFMDFSQFNSSLVKDYDLSIGKGDWQFIYDYHGITVRNMMSVVKTYKDHERWLNRNGKIAEQAMPALDVIKEYQDREKQLKITLLVLQMPILLMLAFYILMVSLLIIDQEKNEIAVMRSRGAGTRQIFASYLMESLVLSAIAMVVGPFLGLFICRMLGASNGFLEFVSRAPLPVSLSVKTYLYSLAAIAVFMATMLIPAFLASRTTIVHYKQQKAGITKKPVWKKFFFDIVLLGVACWGLYSYMRQQKNLDVTGAEATEMSMDPLLFLISTLFVLGAGLVLLRVFPFIIRLIFRMGRSKWSPVFYTSFIQVGRSGGQEQFLMLFIILTLSIGIFNANAARTINTNIEDKIRYSVGADITFQPSWRSNGLEGITKPDISKGTSGEEEPRATMYREPRYERYAKLNGVEAATKVMRKYDVAAQAGSEWADNVELMAIIPDEFSKVSCLRPGLLPAHMNAYLNLLAREQSAILVSRSFEKRYGAEVGDHIVFRWGEQQYIEGVINAFVDYWPTFNPKQKNERTGKEPDLIVANLTYIQALTSVEPYEVWIRKKPERTIGEMSNVISADIEKQNLRIEGGIEDVTGQITGMKNDPMVQSTNGALTMGFIVTMLVSAIGFIIYWSLSIRKRVLQFGIFRAMGLSFRKIIGILLSEQVLISGTSIFAGIMIGGLTSDLFVPLLQIIYSTAQQVPPFVVVAKQVDYIRIYAVMGLMLLVGFTVLGRLISRINVNQAIKLGED